MNLKSYIEQERKKKTTFEFKVIFHLSFLNTVKVEKACLNLNGLLVLNCKWGYLNAISQFPH